MKMKFVKSCLFAAAAGLLASSFAMAQEKAATLDQLLDMVKKSQVSESAEHKQREAEFARDKANQANLLAQAKATRQAEEARSAALEKKYAEQQLLVSQKRAQLNERLGSMRELFGHLTATAGDLRATLDTSLVSAQYPNRGDFLEALIEKMNGSTKLPDIEEIERLWYEIQREMVESGRVVKFNANVIKPSGEQTSQEVVRVGTYNLVSDGKYLTFDGSKVQELPRQPSAHLAGAQALQNAAPGSGTVDFGVDPTGPAGGQLLTALIDTPTFLERVDQGGAVGYVIVVIGIFGVLLGFWRILVLFTVSGKVKAQLKSQKPSTNNPLGRVLKVAEENAKVDTETLELKLEEAVLKERPAIESGLAILKIIAAVAPLLGLLGTVTGMIETFQAITIFGAGDPKNMAGGISAALVTTVQGLVVAIPVVLMHTLVNTRAKAVIQVLDEQTTGIIAENSERSHKA
ncbi:MotA/TolQ/ExbB proton channel family protein [Cellvibrio japonicus]|uniref:MotA/TolQ/ExbB proton channel family protein n=1 Tax=Cellvibrio japonicus (strain Ueda107) TaxID=498211 RepID=B3PIW1_CELJU|nr:MotA/TolQ/ExbB proton channel family protein [Cellvibrio japonicus]ACE85986.1 MotA/TolQ/ExbB proton channel family protein [Cellvibrio japonicus Ueda107]QEI11170.1 energy transducer TonB [Cellvibrio japonicus]QEI14744.1 energy transducer TonB [Cellvibrio japonicus]QEI18324.1 energy transducer TonB [Cellvibrio japonicus]